MLPACFLCIALVTGCVGVRFVIVTHDGVQLYTVAGGCERLVLLEDMVKDVDYHYTRRELYLVTYQHLIRTSLHGGARPQYEVLFDPEDEYRLTSLAVDWLHDVLYWTSGPVLVLYSASLNGSDSRVIHRAGYIEKHLNKLVVDPYVGILFWMTNNEVHSADLEGGHHRGNVFPEVSSVRNIALDTSRRKIYFMAAFEGGNHWFVASSDYDRSSLRRHSSAPQVTYGLGAHGSDVYWIPHEDDSCVWQGNDVYKHDFKLYTASTEQNSTPQVLLTFSEPIWNLRIYHPDLQQPKTNKSVNTVN